MHLIDQQCVHYPVQQLCQVLDVMPSRYYAWWKRQAAGTAGTREPAWETEMLAVFDHHKRRYSARRLQVELREKGYWVGRQSLRLGLRRHRRALQPKAFATDSTPGRRCAPNLLLDQPRPTQSNRMWGQWHHVFGPGQWHVGVLMRLSGVCAEHVVGWQVRADVPESLFNTALQLVLLAQRPAPGLILHSDRGGQYVGNVYIALPQGANAQRSHSRRGECDDNTQAES